MMVIETPYNEKHTSDARLENLVRRNMALAEDAMQRGDFEGASNAFKEAAVASFELGNVEVAMRLLDRQEDASRQQVAAGPRIAKYLNGLQIRVNQALQAGKHGQARDLLKQMLAIAEQVRDLPAVKAIKQQLAFVMRLQGKR
ncbi:MAG: hypothetical protein JW839_13695 [Candidatus Lokiarchaeota archaeon]|nr:hypothetical protein [Candidatus Lokiarchaeota archaeon]